MAHVRSIGARLGVGGGSPHRGAAARLTAFDLLQMSRPEALLGAIGIRCPSPADGRGARAATLVQ
eukprot:2884859-Pyramimonas_sp.AAC.1